jgi:hypothetical protein
VTQGPPDLDDVLDAFAAEPEHDRATLERYLVRYPEHAGPILDLSHELRLQAGVVSSPPSQPDSAWIEESWRQFAAAASSTETTNATAPDPFARLPKGALGEVRKALDLPTSVLIAFRDRIVVASTVPAGFLKRLAVAIGSTADELLAHLALPPRLARGASYKADAGPQAPPEKLEFEQVLEEALVPPERRRALLEDRD